MAVLLHEHYLISQIVRVDIHIFVTRNIPANTRRWPNVVLMLGQR